MKTLYTLSNKGAQSLVERYHKSGDTELRHCYGRYSHEKERAYYLCRQKMLEEHGRDLRIISHNTFFITVGWRTPGGDYRIETPGHSYLIIDLPF